VSRIGDRIREVRRAKRRKQYKIAELSGDPELTANYLSRLENGHEENPGWKRLVSIAKGLSVDVSVLAAPVGTPIPPPQRTAEITGKRGRSSDDSSGYTADTPGTKDGGARGSLPATEARDPREVIASALDAAAAVLRASLEHAPNTYEGTTREVADTAGRGKGSSAASG
jgi:transcriptional regulator with XRE-family HTH domain